MSEKKPRKRRPIGPIKERKRRMKVRSDKEAVRDALWVEFHETKAKYEKIAKTLIGKDKPVTKKLSAKLAANAAQTYKNRPNYNYNEKAKGYISVDEQVFLDSYAINLDIWEGLKASGWSRKGKAFEILNKETSQRYLKTRMIKLKNKTFVDEERVIKGLLQEAEDQENGSPGSRVQAWTQIGRHLAMFTDKKEIDNKVSIETMIADLPLLEDDSDDNVIDVDFDRLEEKDAI